MLKAKKGQYIQSVDGGADFCLDRDMNIYQNMNFICRGYMYRVVSVSERTGSVFVKSV